MNGGSNEIDIDEILRNLQRYLPQIVLGLLLVLAAMGIFSTFYQVEPHERAVVLRFGRRHATTQPGLHFRIPLVDTVLKVSMEEHSLNLPFGFGGGRPSVRSNEEETLVLTGDLNVASVEWTVQWKVTDPEQFLFSFHQRGNELFMEQVVTTAARTVMNRLIGDYSIEEVLTEMRGEISEKARLATQKILEKFDCGVTIVDLQMQRVTPPERVKPSFDAVNTSLQMSKQLTNEANIEKNKLLPAANARKDKLIEDAKGYAKRQWAEADGEINALLAKYRAYQKAPAITRQRLYLEAMQEILGGVGTKTIIDGDLNQILPLLPLEQGARTQ